MSERNQLIQALQLEKDGEWDKAHTIVQGIESPDSYWVHAYLHRVEGDLGNANYWYTRARRSMPETELTEEWSEIAEEIKKRP